MWPLQLCCNTANWKKEALKKVKPQTGFKPAPSRYLLNATISSTSADHINLKIFLKICCFEGQFYLYLQITVFQFNRNLISVRNIEIKIEQITSCIYQNSVLNFNFPLAHAIGCIQKQISIVTSSIETHLLWSLSPNASDY